MFPLKTKDAFTAHLQRPNDVQANASAFSTRWQMESLIIFIPYVKGFGKPARHRKARRQSASNANRRTWRSGITQSTTTSIFPMIRPFTSKRRNSSSPSLAHALSPILKASSPLANMARWLANDASMPLLPAWSWSCPWRSPQATFRFSKSKQLCKDNFLVIKGRAADFASAARPFECWFVSQ